MGGRAERYGVSGRETTSREEVPMSPTKKRQTMAKVARERELKERRALKQEKKDARRAAAAERAEHPDDPFAVPTEEGELEEIQTASETTRTEPS